jgi:hypothetical protein
MSRNISKFRIGEKTYLIIVTYLFLLFSQLSSASTDAPPRSLAFPSRPDTTSPNQISQRQYSPITTVTSVVVVASVIILLVYVDASWAIPVITATLSLPSFKAFIPYNVA